MECTPLEGFTEGTICKFKAFESPLSTSCYRGSATMIFFASFHIYRNDLHLYNMYKSIVCVFESIYVIYDIQRDQATNVCSDHRLIRSPLDMVWTWFIMIMVSSWFISHREVTTSGQWTTPSMDPGTLGPQDGHGTTPHLRGVVLLDVSSGIKKPHVAGADTCAGAW